MKMAFVTGVLISLLVSAALSLFGIITWQQGVSVFLLMFGIWSIVFGLAMTTINNRLYYLGWGIVVLASSSFVVLPPTYVAGLIVVAILVVVIIGIASPRRKKQTNNSTSKVD